MKLLQDARKDKLPITLATLIN